MAGENGLLLKLSTMQKNLLDSEHRLDGRTSEQWASLDLTVGGINTAEGSSTVRFGQTTVTCGVKLKLAAPPADAPSPGVGWLVANIDLLPVCASRFHPGPPSEEAQAMSQWLQDTLLAGGCPRLSELVVVPGRWVWVVHVDVMVVNCDGSLRDACLLATIAALENTRLPQVEFGPDRDSLVLFDKKSRSKLPLDQRPLSITWAIGGPETKSGLLANPNDAEEREFSGVLTAVLDTSTTSGTRLLGFEKLGGPSLSPQKMVQCIRRAEERAREMAKLLDSVLIAPSSS